IPERIFAAVAAAGERICVASTRPDGGEGHLVTLRTADGAKLSSCTLGGRVDTTPAILGTSAFVACDDGSLHAIQTETGAALWAVEAGAEFEAGPSLGDGALYAGT